MKQYDSLINIPAGTTVWSMFLNVIPDILQNRLKHVYGTYLMEWYVVLHDDDSMTLL